MIVSGESLLNDGSAMVVYSLFLSQYLGEDKNVFFFLIQLVLGGIGIGFAFGSVVLYWISLLNRRHNHGDVILQVALTIASSYSCFYVAEGVLGVSGVLAVVTMGTFLAATFWPLIISRSTMEHVWHCLEWLFNTVLFQLAGLIVGKAFYQLIEGATAVESEVASGSVQLSTGLRSADIAWVLLSYVACSIIRFTVVLVCFPLLRRMGYGMSPSEAVVTGWGGLHGSVGLALVMSMHKSLEARGEHQTAQQLLLHVSGVTLLTLIVNAPTLAPLLRYLKMTSESEAQEQAYEDLKTRVSEYAWREYDLLLSQPNSIVPQSTKWIERLPEYISLMGPLQKREKLLEQQEAMQAEAAPDFMSKKTSSRRLSSQMRAMRDPAEASGGEEAALRAFMSAWGGDGGHRHRGVSVQGRGSRSGAPPAVGEVAERPKRNSKVGERRASLNPLQHIGRVTRRPGRSLEQAEDKAEQRLPSTKHTSGNEDAARRLVHTRKQFLQLLKQAYTNMLEDGVMPPRSTLALDLIASVDLASDRVRMPIYDWMVITRHLSVPIATRLLLRLPEVVFRLPGMMKLLWRLGIESYEIHTTYLLTCFISAHEQAEEEMHWMYGQRLARLHKEEVKVANESRTAVREARRYLQDMAKVMVHGQDLADVIDSVRVRQAASLLLHRIERLILQMHEHGIFDAHSAERLLHLCEHDGVKMHKRRYAHSSSGGGRLTVGESLAESGVSVISKLRAEMSTARDACEQLRAINAKYVGNLEQILPRGGANMSRRSSTWGATVSGRTSEAEAEPVGGDVSGEASPLAGRAASRKASRKGSKRASHIRQGGKDLWGKLKARHQEDVQERRRHGGASKLLAAVASAQKQSGMGRMLQGISQVKHKADVGDVVELDEGGEAPFTPKGFSQGAAVKSARRRSVGLGSAMERSLSTEWTIAGVGEPMAC